MDARFEGLVGRYSRKYRELERRKVDMGNRLHKAIKCHEYGLECYGTVEEDFRRETRNDARESSMKMIGSEAEAKRCFSIDARAQCEKKVGVAVHRHGKSTDL